MREGSSHTHPISSLVRLFDQLQSLKRLPRTGWLDRGVPAEAVESVADHTLLSTLIAWQVASDDPALDADRVLKLALIHDLAEAIVGDEPPYAATDVPPREDLPALREFFSRRHLRSPENIAAKRVAEHEAATQLQSLMPDGGGDEFAALWDEVERQESPESRFVKEVDRLEAFLQSRQYGRNDPDLPLFGFTDMAMKEVHHPVLAAIRDAVLDAERTQNTDATPSSS